MVALMAAMMVDMTADMWVGSKVVNWVGETVDSKADSWVVWMAAPMAAGSAVLKVGWSVEGTAVRWAASKAVSWESTKAQQWEQN